MKSVISVTVAILSVFCASSLRAQVETFDLPRLDEIRIDGDFSDWDDGQGFGVEVLLHEEGRRVKEVGRTPSGCDDSSWSDSA